MDQNKNGNAHGCLLKGTKISAPSIVDCRMRRDEVQTLAGRKTIKWIGYNRFTKGRR
jgi:hypothetical protein